MSRAFAKERSGAALLALGSRPIVHCNQLLHATLDLPADTHVQFFVRTGVPSAPPPAPTATDLFPSPWRAIPSDVSDFFLTLDGSKAPALWIGARFDNDGHGTPALSQLRVDFDQDGYLPYLPAIYGERGCDDFLLRFLSLFESFFDELEGKIREGLEPGDLGEIHSYWSGPTETAMYIYGPSRKAIREAIEGVRASYPLCKNSRVEDIGPAVD